MIGRKGMDEFVYVLMAGMLFIMVMLLWVGMSPEGEDNITDVTQITGAFSIGSYPKDIPRYIRIGDFTVSYAVGSEVIKTGRNVEVKKGLTQNKPYTMSGEIEQNTDLVTSGFVVISVLNTNSQGNLIVKINDEKVFDQVVRPGKIEIPLDKNVLKDYNVVEISCSHPSWKFWSSTVYSIDKVEMGINFYGNLQKSESFLVYEDELKDFKSAEVSFRMDDFKGEGDIIISINDVMIFKGEPSLRFNQMFDALDVRLGPGINTISFSAESGASYDIEDAEIIIIHEEPGRKTRSFDFDVSSSQYDNLEGEIEFYIGDSNHLGSLLITITDAGGNRHPTETIQSYSVGETITVEFDETYVDIGTNTVTFEASGDGSFVLSNVEIRV